MSVYLEISVNWIDDDVINIDGCNLMCLYIFRAQASQEWGAKPSKNILCCLVLDSPVTLKSQLTH